MTAPPVIPAATARRLLMGGKGLLGDPARRATPAAVRKLIEHLGFVQVDTISVAARAHDHILMSRFDDYEPAMLAKLLERDRSLFEHWTHDASIIRADWRPWWQVRYVRYAERTRSRWWQGRLGPDPERLLDDVESRIRAEGPLMSRDFETPPGAGGPWWGWKPAKAALEYLWRTGRLTIVRRERFQKVYDLTERVFPGAHPHPCDATHADWACRAALERLGVATPAELAGFAAAVSNAEATAWCKAAAAKGDVVPVLVEDTEGNRRPAFARPDWNRVRLPAAPDRIRLLSPFDPVVRDRKRALRLFGFDYRFEAFVPAPKRKYGYYVMPLLEGDAIVGRADVKLHRAERLLEVKGLWWEPGITPDAPRRQRLDDAIDVFASALDADHWTLPPRSRRSR